MILLLSTFALLAARVVLGEATCYNPDGSVIAGLAYQPCNMFAGSVSTCCGTNHTGNIAPDVCLANGLCKNTGDNVIWRQGCTDKTWKSPFCLSQLCTTTENGGNPKGNIAVGQCDDGSWVCGGKNATRCNEGLGVVLAASIGASSSRVSSTASKTKATGTRSPTSSPTTSPTPTPTPSSGLSTGAKAGIGIGAALGALAIIAVLAFILLRRRKAKKVPDMAQTEHAGVKYHEVDATRHPAEVAGDTQQPVKEVYKSPVEVPANTFRAELPC